LPFAFTSIILSSMRAVNILRRKRDGHPLDASEIDAFVRGVTTGEWPDYQAAALLMAIVLRGMNAQETAHLTRAMVESGARLDWSNIPGPKVDKHSTGGVGDKTSLILAPLAAACGCVVPMMSGRGLGHTGGTLDKLESIPSFRVNLAKEQMWSILNKVGCVIVGQTRDVAPADKILYGLRDVTGTVESIPLITASILSKKIAEGIDALVMDVKCGHGAFMKTRADAKALAEAIVVTGRNNGVRTEALITSMDAPIGRMVGNALEVRESIDTLRGEGPKDLADLTIALTSGMVLLGGLAKSAQDAEIKVRSALKSGAALERFRLMVEAQGGDPAVVDDTDLLVVAPHRLQVRAERPGYVAEIHAEYVGLATMLLGAGRDRVEDSVDHSVGVRILAKPGEHVRENDALVEVCYRNEARLPEAVVLLQKAWRIDDARPAEQRLILERVISPLSPRYSGESGAGGAGG
jgi:pyrimidine-nucleoside phosphorylase